MILSKRIHVLHYKVTSMFLNYLLGKTDLVYGTIETLLPNSGFKESTKRGKLLELWCMPETKRKGWTSVYFKDTPFKQLKDDDDESSSNTILETFNFNQNNEIESFTIPVSDEEFSDDAFDDPEDIL
jgi:hypothetical protein